MINLNVIYIYIRNKHLLFKSFCKIINPKFANDKVIFLNVAFSNVLVTVQKIVEKKKGKKGVSNNIS